MTQQNLIVTGAVDRKEDPHLRVWFRLLSRFSADHLFASLQRNEKTDDTEAQEFQNSRQKKLQPVPNVDQSEPNVLNPGMHPRAFTGDGLKSRQVT